MSRLFSNLALVLPLGAALVLFESCGNSDDRVVTGQLDRAQFRLVDAQAIAIGNGGATYRVPIQDDGSFVMALPVGHRYTLRFANSTTRDAVYDAFAILTYDIAGQKRSWFKVTSGAPLELGLIHRTDTTIARGLEAEDDADSDGSEAEASDADVDADSDANSDSDDLDSDSDEDSDAAGGVDDVNEVCDMSGGADLQEVEAESGLPEDDSDEDSDSSADANDGDSDSSADADDGDSDSSADDGDSDSSADSDSDSDSDGDLNEVCDEPAGSEENDPNTSGSEIPPGEADPVPGGGSADGSTQPGNL